MKLTKYLKQRKKLVMEERELIYKRIKLNKQIREIQRDLYGLDTILIKEMV